MLSHLFVAALWSPEGKGLTYKLLFVMFIVILLLSHLVSWDRCAPVRKGPAGIQVNLNTWNLKKITGGFFFSLI